MAIAATLGACVVCVDTATWLLLYLPPLLPYPCCWGKPPGRRLDVGDLGSARWWWHRSLPIHCSLVGSSMVLEGQG
jgi:hypothetical protein